MPAKPAPPPAPPPAAAPAADEPVTDVSEEYWMTEPGGDAYKGARNDANQAHGKGMLKLLSGETYDGGFKNDKMDGIGKHKWKSGAEYEGEWSEDTRHGIGTYKFPDKSIFVGRFKKNLRETIKGTYTWANGEIYEGGFKGDKLEGQGIFYWSSGRMDLNTYAAGRPKGDGVRWNAERTKAWALSDGNMKEEIDLEGANAQLAAF